MKRRRYIKSTVGLAVLSTGCISKPPSERKQENLAITNITEDYINAQNIDISVEPIETDSGTMSPPKIKIIFTNNKNRETVIAGTEGSVFGTQVSNNEEMLLLKEKSYNEDDLYENCLKVKQEQPIINSSYRNIIDSDSSVSTKYELIRSSEGDSCMEKGEYRFQTYYELKENTINEDILKENFNWGFQVELSRVN